MVVAAGAMHVAVFEFIRSSLAHAHHLHVEMQGLVGQRVVAIQRHHKPSLPNDVRLDLELLSERRFRNGVVFLHYRTSMADSEHPATIALLVPSGTLDVPIVFDANIQTRKHARTPLGSSSLSTSGRSP